jgi:general secretion pathway protein D
MRNALLVLGFCAVLSGCFQPMKPTPSGHLGDQPPAPAANIPPPVRALPIPPRPKPTVKAETYSVVVNNVNVRELLFALARDAKVNVDIHPGIAGTVTLNAIDQTLPQLLSRISKQVDMRYELDGPNLAVMPDSPYLRVYKIDYVNMDRQMTGTVNVSGRIAGAAPTGGAGGGTSGGGAGGGAASGGTSGGTSNVAITNRSNNRFWETLTSNIEQLLRDTDKILPGGGPGAAAPSGQPGAQGGPPPQAGGGASVPTSAGQNVTFREAASVITNPEASVITVRATARQHERIQEFLDQVLVNAKRQVLIEATIVEVILSNGYQQGIDWNILRTGTAGISGGFSPQGATATPLLPGLIAVPNASAFSLAYTSASFLASLKLLETFGTVRVLSSPRISVVNNQTAVLKVVESIVYFQVSSNTSQAQTTALTTFATTPQSVDVGIVLNVTPQISETDAVLLNIKPSVTSVTSFVDDPNPSLRNPCGNVPTCNIQPIPNRVPQVQTREMESVLRLTSGQIGVMGGLIQDRVENNSDTVPGVNRIPLIGETLFSNKVALSRKVELVIFLRPLVVRDPTIDGDYRAYRVFLPGEDFMGQPHPAGPRLCDPPNIEGCPQ